ncbi:hypothetical protein LzC2_32430 [Planctomycetes bacterium LzC2]|uniref:DUF883 domain-containing protein n=1 Tax=Alienimonas chondri TaxID=2681879 RepID=A0ABX1VIP1_9PLAN|nr:hypothetical protein [Alienimonas chondri]
MNRFPRPPALAPPVNPPPANRTPQNGTPQNRTSGSTPSGSTPSGRRLPQRPAAAASSGVSTGVPLSGLRSPSPGIRLAEPGLKDVAAGWVASHPAIGLGAAAAVGLALGWALKRR